MWHLLIFVSSIKFCQNTLWGKPCTLVIPQAKSTTSTERVSGCRLPPYQGTLNPKNPNFYTNTAGSFSLYSLSLLTGYKTNDFLSCTAPTPWSWCSTGCAEWQADATLSTQGGPGTHIFTTDLIPIAVGNGEMPDVTPFVNFLIKIAVFMGQNGWISIISCGSN